MEKKIENIVLKRIIPNTWKGKNIAQNFVQNGASGAANSRQGLEKGHVYNSDGLWTQEVSHMIKTAKNYQDLDAIGAKFDEVINNKDKYNVDLFDYVVDASRKMRQIYNVLGEPGKSEKGERRKITREQMEKEMYSKK